jgi:hypothetical protein
MTRAAGNEVRTGQDFPEEEAQARRAQQVRAALKEIMPSASDRAACRAAVEEKLDVIAMFGKADRAFAASRSDAASKALEAHHKKLVQLRKTFQAVLKSGGEHRLRWAPARGWHEVLTLADIDFLIWASVPPPKRKDRPVAAKPMTAWFARDLLERYCPDKHIVTTKGGRWHTLSAILYGDPTADLYQHLLAFQIFSRQK